MVWSHTAYKVYGSIIENFIAGIVISLLKTSLSDPSGLYNLFISLHYLDIRHFGLV